jgi:protein tyrosine phosphatase (PTP) superfamily phosphohydrolase (DUF442 family)
MKLNRQIVLIAGVVFLAVNAACFAGETNPPATPTRVVATNRPVSWAQPLTLPGLTNFYRVTTNLYRGAQPTAAGFGQLQALGIKTVINLRSFHSDKDEVAGTGLKSIRLEVKPWHAEEEDVVAFLKAATDTNNLPVFVHCQRGADRTGMMCAMYRIIVFGWTKPEAIEEMKRGGYHFSPAWKNLVAFIEKADIAEIKQRTGLAGK